MASPKGTGPSLQSPFLLHPHPPVAVSPFRRFIACPRLRVSASRPHRVPVSPFHSVSASLLPGQEEGERQAPYRKEQKIAQRLFDAHKIGKGTRR